MIEHRTGDLFAQTDVRAIGHGVNCQGMMGAGIAVPFKFKFPKMYLAYRTLCDSLGPDLIGDIFPWTYRPEGAQENHIVFNLFTQVQGGRDARYSAVESAVRRACLYAQSYGVDKIAIPQIGCGIGGLEWAKVEEVLAQIDTPVTIVVVTLPETAPVVDPKPARASRGSSAPLLVPVNVPPQYNNGPDAENYYATHRGYLNDD